MNLKALAQAAASRLAKGKNGGWAKEGYKFHYSVGTDAADDLEHIVTVTHPSSKENVGTFTFGADGMGGIEAHNAFVHKDHRRKGIASQAYQIAANQSSKRVMPSFETSKDADKFWDTKPDNGIQPAKKSKDLIPGGLADDKKLSDFPKKSIAQGSKVEREHTSSPAIAKEITMDHLTEDPRYYDKLKTIEKSGEDDYRIQHTAPTSDGGAPIHNLSGTFPDDIYGSKGASYYGHGVNYDHTAVNIIRSAKDKPNAKIRIYRAVPKIKTNAEKIDELTAHKAHIQHTGKLPRDAWQKSVGNWSNKSEYYEFADNMIESLKKKPEIETKPLSINRGDWITTTREYAKEHGEGVHGRGGYRILTKLVPAKHVYTDGNSIHEYGYDPGGTKLSKSDSTKQVASIAVINGDRLLMGKRNDNQRITLPGGHLNQGEQTLTGAARELLEETGIKVDPKMLHLLGSEEVTTFTGKQMIIHSYACFGHFDTNTELDPDQEVQHWKWIDISRGLPYAVSSNLHSPKNTTLRLLGLQNEKD